jgi:hypothetical protein
VGGVHILTKKLKTMNALIFKEKEIKRLNEQIALGRISLIPARDAALAESYALQLQANGSNVKLLNPDNVPGVLQQETATFLGVVTTAGTVNVVVTSAHIASTTVGVALLLGDTAEEAAEKARIAMAATPAITAEFTVSGEGADLILTAINYYGDDATLNIAISDAAAVTGITPAPTSEDTTEGDISKKSLPVTVGNIFCSGDEEGFELTLPSAALTTGQKVFIKKTDTGAGSIVIKCAGTDTIEGDATLTLALQYEFIYIISGGDGWYYILSDIA